MYTIDDLNVRLLSELKDIAEKMGVKNAKKLAKQELVYKILDQQALVDTPGKPPEDSGDRKIRPRRRENVAPQSAPREEAQRTEPPQPVNQEAAPTVTRFEEPQPRFEEAPRPPKQQQQPQQQQPQQQQQQQQQQQPPNIIEPGQRAELPPDRQQQSRILNIKDFDGAVTSEGVLELMQDGYGFLRSSDYNYLASPENMDNCNSL